MSSDKQAEFLGEKIIVVQEDQTLLQASLQNGIPHFHACGGNAKSSTCRIVVLKGMDQLSGINEKERTLRKMPTRLLSLGLV